MDKKPFFNYDYAPFCFLEGGTGLNDVEEKLYQKIVDTRAECWSIEDLYDKPERIVALQFLKPKTIIFGTTGVYEKELSHLFKVAEVIDFDFVERLYLTLDTMRDAAKFIRPLLKKYPNIKVFSVDFFDYWDFNIKEVTVSKRKV